MPTSSAYLFAPSRRRPAGAEAPTWHAVQLGVNTCCWIDANVGSRFGLPPPLGGGGGGCVGGFGDALPPPPPPPPQPANIKPTVASRTLAQRTTRTRIVAASQFVTRVEFRDTRREVQALRMCAANEPRACHAGLRVLRPRAPRRAAACRG